MILVDSSVWISYFRGDKKKHCEILDDILNSEQIVISGTIEAELFIGARTKKMFNTLVKAMSNIQVTYEFPELWKTVGQNGALLRSKGVTVPFSDLVIASHCIEIKARLLHNDKHFKMISKYLELKSIA